MSEVEWLGFPNPPTSYSIAVIFGILGGILYLVLAYIVAVLTGPEFTGGNYGLLLLYSIITIGIPIVFWFRYGLRGPLVLLSAIIVFWHIIVPLFGSEGDGTPVFALAIAIAPLYILGYVVISGLELWLQ